MSRTVSDYLGYNRKSAEYRMGCAQLREWHEQCRAKRLGLPFRPRRSWSVSNFRTEVR